MKISISCDWGGTIALYELKRDVGLMEHIDIICKELKAPDPSANYALFNEANNTYIKPEVPTSSHGQSWIHPRGKRASPAV